MQANPSQFKMTMQSFRDIFTGNELMRSLGHKQGLVGLMKGWSPTVVGYSIQGACKFGIYEILKHKLSNQVGEETAIKYRDLVKKIILWKKK